jgi:hypothetical protein
MQNLQRLYLDIMLLGFAAGIAVADFGLLFDVGHLRIVVMGSPDPAPVFALIAAMFGSAFSCLRFGYEVIEQALAERAAAKAAVARRANPWTAGPDWRG